jgi:hypothetical protein
MKRNKTKVPKNKILTHVPNIYLTRNKILTFQPIHSDPTQENIIYFFAYSF